MVLRDDVRQQLVLALGQLDKGTDAVNVGIGFHVQHVVSPWGDSRALELLVWGSPFPCWGVGRESLQLLGCSQTGSRWEDCWQKAERTPAELPGLEGGEQGLSPAFV